MIEILRQSPEIAKRAIVILDEAYNDGAIAEYEAIGCTVEIWPERLALGETLPTIPLWLRGSVSLPLELNATYERTCREQRIRY